MQLAVDGLSSKETSPSIKTQSEAEGENDASKQSGNVDKQQINNESKPPKQSNFLFDYDSDCSWSKYYFNFLYVLFHFLLEKTKNI